MKRFISAAALLSILFLFVSCKEKVMGYSVVLWNIPEQEISAGQVVPVYIKSNISHVYVAGLSADAKFEVPLWQMTAPVSKKKAGVEAQRYADYAHTYASSKIDGLPIRAETVNTSKQVYRLRKGETVKILYKGKGQAVMAGKNPLEGDWLRVLTDNGTMGWCFSYNLAQFETDAKGQRVGGNEIVEEVAADEEFEKILGSVWYPDYFKTLIDGGNIDTSKLNVSYKFAIDTENNKVTLVMKDIHESWDYDGYTKTGDKEYSLKGIPCVVYYKNAGFIVVRYTGLNGKPQDLNFVTIQQNIPELIAAEKDRRAEIYSHVYEAGPKFKSSSYGTITLTENGTFTWNNYKLFVPSVISSTAKNGGSVSIKYNVSKSLSANYDGVLTFKFEGMQNEVNFLYKMENGGLRLESVSAANMDGNLVKSRGNNSIVAFFSIE